jgi:hypothetical protein
MKSDAAGKNMGYLSTGMREAQKGLNRPNGDADL